MQNSKTGTKKIIIEAVVTRADGRKEDLGKIAEIESSKTLLEKIKSLFTRKGEING